MGAPILRPFVLMLGGTSLTDGRLCTPPIPWTKYLLDDMRGAEEAVGPVFIINTGKGSQTSNFGASQAALMAPLRPSHVLMEDFGINDCAMGVTINQATANFNSMVASYRASNPDVVIVHQTMSPASAGDVNRTTLEDYYDNGLANAVLNDVESIDNYYGTPLVPGGWVKPLPLNLTVGYAPLAGTPSGFGMFSPANTLNPADTSADITLSNGDLTATKAAGGGAWDSSRAVVSVSSGKWYWETTVSVLNGADAIITGICQAGLSLANYVGSTATSWGWAKTGAILNNTATIDTYDTYAAGDVIGIALDLTNNRLWFRKNTGNWNNSGSADPATNTGGIAITAGTYFPGISIFRVADAFTMAFGNPGDGLHPVWASAFQTYSYPNILAWARQAMADYW